MSDWMSDWEYGVWTFNPIGVELPNELYHPERRPNVSKTYVASCRPVDRRKECGRKAKAYRSKQRTSHLVPGLPFRFMDHEAYCMTHMPEEVRLLMLDTYGVIELDYDTYEVIES